MPCDRPGAGAGTARSELRHEPPVPRPQNLPARRGPPARAAPGSRVPRVSPLRSGRRPDIRASGKGCTAAPASRRRERKARLRGVGRRVFRAALRLPVLQFRGRPPPLSARIRSRRSLERDPHRPSHADRPSRPRPHVGAVPHAAEAAALAQPEFRAPDGASPVRRPRTPRIPPPGGRESRPAPPPPPPEATPNRGRSPVARLAVCGRSG